MSPFSRPLAVALCVACAALASAVPSSLVHALRRTAALHAAGRQTSHPGMRESYDAGRLVLDYVVKTSRSAHAVVSARPGWKVVSGGVDARPDGEARMYATASFPELDASGTPVAWRASANPVPGAARTAVEACAVLLYDPDNLWEVAGFHVSHSGVGDVSATATLPEREGYTLVGAGAKVIDGSGRVFLRDVELVGGDSVRVSVPGGCADGAETKVSAFVVGVRRVGHAVRAIRRSGSGDGDATSVWAAVPAELDDTGYALTSIGASVRGEERCDGFIDVLKPAVYGEEARASARFEDSTPADGAIDVTGLMVEDPSIFY